MAISQTNYSPYGNFTNQVSELPYAASHSSVSYASLINPDLPDNRLRENADRTIELIPNDFGYVIGESCHNVACRLWSVVTDVASRILSSLNFLPVVEAKEPEPEYLIVDGSDSSEIYSRDDLDVIVLVGIANYHMSIGNISGAMGYFEDAIKKVEDSEGKCHPGLTEMLESLKAVYNVTEKRSTAS